MIKLRVLQTVVDLPPRVRSDIQLIAKLGSGTYGSVWSGKQNDTDVVVKLAELSDEGEVETFLNEVYVNTVLRNYKDALVCDNEAVECVLPTMDSVFITDNDVGVMIFPYKTPDSLSQYIRSQPRLRPMLSFLQSILRNTLIIHRTGVVHMDMKPENIIVFDGDETSFIDMGMACFDIEDRERRDAGSATTIRRLLEEQRDRLASEKLASQRVRGYIAGVTPEEILACIVDNSSGTFADPRLYEERADEIIPSFGFENAIRNDIYALAITVFQMFLFNYVNTVYTVPHTTRTIERVMVVMSQFASGSINSYLDDDVDSSLRAVLFAVVNDLINANRSSVQEIYKMIERTTARIDTVIKRMDRAETKRRRL